MERPKLSLQLAVRVFADGQKCFGSGAAELLERVDRGGSLRVAAAEMGMAYSNAWTTLRGCETALGFPLLVRKSGGRLGGSSLLTPRGRALLEGYRRLEARLEKQQASLLAEIALMEEE